MCRSQRRNIRTRIFHRASRAYKAVAATTASNGSRWASFCSDSQSLPGRLPEEGAVGWVLLQPRGSHGEKDFSGRTSQESNHGERMERAEIELASALEIN